MTHKFRFAALAALAAFAAPAVFAASSLTQSLSNRLVAISITPTISGAPAHSAGDSVGGKLELANAVERARGAGVIRDVTLADSTNAQGAIDVFFFAADPSASTLTDNAAASFAAADLANAIGFVSITSYSSGASRALGRGEANRPLHFVIPSGTSLYAAMVARGSMTLSPADGLTLRVVIERS
jgi:hypothetical protein